MTEIEQVVTVAPRAWALTNGAFTTVVTAAGGGFSNYQGLALTRHFTDPLRPADGVRLYVRDVESGEFAALVAGAGEDAFRFEPGLASALQELFLLEARLEVCVCPDDDVEIRRLTLHNPEPQLRRVDVTTYAELVLAAPAADAAHPAFSKLFVQTDFLRDAGAILAWRRPRGPEDEPIWLAHLLRLEQGEAADPGLQVETDRMRFVGRARTPDAPAALLSAGPLSGTVGNVLDPVASLRRTMELRPGELTTLVAVTAAAATRAQVVELAERYARAGALEPIFATAAERARAGGPTQGGALALDDHRAHADGLAGAGAAQPDGAGLRAGLAAIGPAPRFRPAAPADAPAVRAPTPMAGQTLSAPADAARAPAPGRKPATRADVAAGRAPAPAAEQTLAPPDSLRFFNGLGGFRVDGGEYVIRIEPTPAGPALPPLPWTHIVANEDVGFIVSERGAAQTWSGNSRENRLTPWYNDPVCDPHGEALYIRDEEAGVFWSPTPGPVPAPVPYEVAWGFGYGRWRSIAFGLEQEVTAFVPPAAPVKVVRVRVRNATERARRLSLFSYARWVLGTTPGGSATLSAAIDPEDPRTSLARNPANRDFAGRVAFAHVVAPRTATVSATADRTVFLGPGGDPADPIALRTDITLDGHSVHGRDACAAFRVELTLGPGESAECSVLLGQAADEGAARAVLAEHADAAAIDVALQATTSHWQDLLGRVHVETPAPAIDLMVNGWVAYQDLACRIFARSAFYQSGGAYGYRDQLQDAAALIWLDPALVRAQILLHAAHQFVEGDVLHWWHPPLDRGIRTRFSDDLLWLPYVAASYVQATGDDALLDESAPFLTARPLAPGEDEVLLRPEASGASASVYEHCCRALDRSLKAGAHGLPLIGTGDWNDGMNRVGREGRGESVWLGFFLYDILERFVRIAEARGDRAHAARWAGYRARLHDALEQAGWDGAWYRRAFYDDGTPLGSVANRECRIDAIAQAWAVLSGAASPAHAHAALDALERQLVREREGLIALLAPPFDRTEHDPGYIKGYGPGVRENGGQYTHGALWAVRALAEAGRTERAARLLELLTPVAHTRTPAGVTVYRAEPYVVAADVYGVAPHVGRAGWTWYTGSAGWMLRVALESVLGLALEGGDTLRLCPCIPADWPGFTVTYRLPGDAGTYEIRVTRVDEDARTTEATLDGERLAVADGAVVIPLTRDGGRHRVEVTLGDDVGPTYRPR